MMEAILDILRINETVVYFAYGQVFFTLGVVIAIQSRKHSRLALAQHLRWLAAFGIVHGVYEWGHTFIPIQAAYLSPDVVAALETIRTAALAVSFYLLGQFGMLVVWHRANRWLLHLLPLALLLGWLAVSLATQVVAMEGYLVRVQLPEASMTARLMLGFTGAALASVGMVRQAQLVANMGSRRIAWYFRWAALCFAVYAIVAGLITSRGEWTLLSLSTLPLFASATTVPPPVLRSIAGLGLAVGVIRGLEVFQLETDRLIQEKDELQRKKGIQAHLLARVIDAQEEERKRVARELHDETGQTLSAVIMGLGAMANALPENPVKAREILDDVREVAVQTLDGVRQIILGLRPALLDDLGLTPALQRVAEDFARRSSVHIDVLAGDLDRRLPPDVETVLFRILQEGLSNVARHSRAQHAVLRLGRNGSTIGAVLEDDGVGFDPGETMTRLDSGSGLGLVGMRERAALLGGTVAIDSSPGRGTRISVELPLPERSQ